MNESLRRALLRSGLSEEDVAARLEVDPKTIRRWLEGRLPYLRYRWALAGMLGVDEVDLWPQLRASGAVPAEVQAIYPHLNAVPREVWLSLFRSAGQKIDILAGSGDSVLKETGVQAVLAHKGQAGIAVRICLVGPESCSSMTGQEPGWVHPVVRVPVLAEALSDTGSCVQLRLRGGVLYAAIYRADDDVLVSQRAYGIPDSQAPVLHLRADADGPLAAAHLESFERFWNGHPAGE